VRIDAKIPGEMALQEVLAMVLLPNWLDARRKPIENWSGDEELPKAGKNCRASGKSRSSTE